MSDTTQRPFITASQVEEVEAHRFIADASDLQWPPGYFPEVLDTSLGNKLPFYRVSLTAQAAKYEQHSGCISLTVLND